MSYLNHIRPSETPTAPETRVTPLLTMLFTIIATCIIAFVFSMFMKRSKSAPKEVPVTTLSPRQSTLNPNALPFVPSFQPTQTLSPDEFEQIENEMAELDAEFGDNDVCNDSDDEDDMVEVTTASGHKLFVPREAASQFD